MSESAYDRELKGVVVLSPMEWTLGEFARRIRVTLQEEQNRVRPDNALVTVLCNAARLGKEHIDYMRSSESERLTKAADALENVLAARDDLGKEGHPIANRRVFKEAEEVLAAIRPRI